MFLLTHRWLRGVFLGLMFFLAGTACCWSDSYDPNPYDDIPPVVTVEFNYVVPTPVSVRAPKVQGRAPHQAGMRAARRQDFATPQIFVESRTPSAAHQSLSQLVIPLRR